jgi:hypothetical protein
MILILEISLSKEVGSGYNEIKYEQNFRTAIINYL